MKVAHLLAPSHPHVLIRSNKVLDPRRPNQNNNNSGSNNKSTTESSNCQTEFCASAAGCCPKERARGQQTQRKREGPAIPIRERAKRRAQLSFSFWGAVSLNLASASTFKFKTGSQREKNDREAQRNTKSVERNTRIQSETAHKK